MYNNLILEKKKNKVIIWTKRYFRELEELCTQPDWGHLNWKRN